MTQKTTMNDKLFVKKIKGENEADFGDLLSTNQNYLNNNKKKVFIHSYIDDEDTIEHVEEGEEEEIGEENENKGNLSNQEILRTLLNSNSANQNSNENLSSPSPKFGFSPNNVDMPEQQISLIKNELSFPDLLEDKKQSIEPIVSESDVNLNNNSNNKNNTIHNFPLQNVSGNNNNINNNIVNYNINSNNTYAFKGNNNFMGFQQQNMMMSQMMPGMGPFGNPLFYSKSYMNNMNSMNNYGYNMNNPLMQNQYMQSPHSYQTQNYLNYSDASLAQMAPFLIKEQSGCRFIQDKVQSNPQFANTLLFPYLLKTSYISEFICDQFGNYLFQVLVDILSSENLLNLVKMIKPHIYTISISPHGTRFLQKLIDKISHDDTKLNEFTKGLITMPIKDIMKDPYGNHIIQKFLLCVNDERRTSFIYSLIEENFMEITNTKHGVCVIQKCFSEGNNYQRKKIVNLITENINSIIKDQFGNYLIQYLLTSPETRVDEIDGILNFILGNILSLCKLKFSANVIEKCFENSNEILKNKIITSMVQNNYYIIQLLLDQFGNYVVQKALLVAKGEQYMRMLKIICEGVDELKQASFGNKLIMKLVNTHKDLGILLAESHQGMKEMQNMKKYNRYNKNWKK